MSDAAFRARLLAVLFGTDEEAAATAAELTRERILQRLRQAEAAHTPASSGAPCRDGRSGPDGDAP